MGRYKDVSSDARDVLNAVNDELKHRGHIADTHTHNYVQVLRNDDAA